MKRIIQILSITAILLNSTGLLGMGEAGQERNRINALLKESLATANESNKGFERIETAWKKLDQAKEAIQRLKNKNLDTREFELALCKHECEIAIRYLATMFGRYPNQGWAISNGTRVGLSASANANVPQRIATNDRQVLRDITYDLARLFDQATGNAVSSRSLLPGESEHPSVSARLPAKTTYDTMWMRDVTNELHNLIQTLTAGAPGGRSPGNLGPVLSLIGAQDTQQAIKITSNLLRTIFGTSSSNLGAGIKEIETLLVYLGGVTGSNLNVPNITNATAMIQGFRNALDPRQTNLDDAMDTLNALRNFMGLPANATIVDAINSLNQWLGDPMGNTPPAVTYDPYTTTFDLKSYIVPGWRSIKMLLATARPSIAPAALSAIPNTEIFTNLNTILNKIAPNTPTRSGKDLIDTLNNILDLCGKTGGIAASNLDEAITELSNTITTIGNSLPTPITPIPGIPIALYDLVDKAFATVPNDLADFLTDASGNPAGNFTAALNNVDTFQQAIARLIAPPAGQNVNLQYILDNIDTMVPPFDTTVDANNKLKTANYNSTNAWIDGHKDLVRQILDSVFNLH